MFTSQTHGNHADYILQESHEKQYQLLLQTHHQAQRLKNKIITAGKTAIDEEYRKKHREASLQRQIYMNVLNNEHKLTRLKARYTLCEMIYQEVQIRLKNFATEQENSHQYQLFLISSIVEGLLRMFEYKVDIRCLDQDRSIIENLLPEIRQIYKDFMLNNIGFEYPLEIRVAPNFQLASRDPQAGPLLKNKEDGVGIGGVILADQSGNITFKATLDSRLNILKEICLPMIRQMIWSKKEDQAQTASQ